MLTVEPILLVGAMGTLGLMIGSFLNVVIHRLPQMMERDWRAECALLLEPDKPPAKAATFNLATPRSRCPGCNTPISARDNIPILSYLLLRGRCRHCGNAISLRYPLIELTAGGVAALAAWQFAASGGAMVTHGELLQMLAAAILAWSLIALAMIDFDTCLLPDSLTLPLLWIGIGCGFHGYFAPELGSAVLGAMFGYLSLWSVYWLFKLVTGKEGMGYGDFKLLAALGAWFGWQALPALILLSSVVGAVIGIGLMVFGNLNRSQPIPFGPYLALAGLLMLFWSGPILSLFEPAAAL